MTKSKWFEEFNHDLLRFPPLVWVSSFETCEYCSATKYVLFVYIIITLFVVFQVVQDFVQQTTDEETPTEWLHRIMDTSSREEGDYDINLLGVG